MRLNKLQKYLIRLGLPLRIAKTSKLPNGTRVKFKGENRIGELIVNGVSYLPSQHYGHHPFWGCNDYGIGYMCTDCGAASNVQDYESRLSEEEYGSCNMIHTYCWQCKHKDTIGSVWMSDIIEIIFIPAAN